MGPKKTKKSKTSNDKKDKDKQASNVEVIQKLKALLKEYEVQSNRLKSKVDVQVKKSVQECIAESKYLVRFTLHGLLNNDTSLYRTNFERPDLPSPPPPVKDVINAKTVEVLSMKVSPLIKALRVNWYKHIKELYLWDLEIPREEITEMNAFFSQPCYQVEYLEILECKMDRSSIFDLSCCLGMNQSLTTLVLDYTNLQLNCLLSLSDGLLATKSLKKLSLCYCNLCCKCGRPLGKLISQTSISELYLDGNFLECTGIVHLLIPIVDQSEIEYLERKTRALESTQRDHAKSSSAVGVYHSSSKVVSEKTKSNSTNVKSKGKKKKKKKSKKALMKGPPKVGAWLSILHAANIGLDGASTEKNRGLLYEALHLLSRWIITCEDLKEIDLDGNLIGEYGGREILSALLQRKQDELKPIFMKVTHRIDNTVFKQIVSLATRSTKRGGKKKKKKKGAAGKKRI